MSIVFAIFYGFIGIGLFGAVLLRPGLFWYALVVATIGFAGLMVWGHALVDEYMIGMIVLAIVLLILFKKVALVRTEQSTLAKVHQALFLVLMGYLTLEAFRGMVVLEDIRMLHWIMFFAMLGVLGFLLPRLSLPKPTPEHVSFLVVLTSVIYFGAYLLHGISAELVRHIPWHELQGMEWTGTSVAFFPLLFALPAIFLLWEKKTSLQWRIGLLVAFLVMVIASLYYDSRVAWLTIILASSFVIAFGLILRKKSTIAVGGLFLVCFLTSMQIWPYINTAYFHGAEKISFITFDSGVPRIIIPSVISLSDRGRIIHNKAAFSFMTSEKDTLFVGHGWYVTRVIFGEYLVDFREMHGLETDFVKSNGFVYSGGAAAILIDTGLIGVLLFLLTGLVALVRLFQRATIHALYASMLFAGVFGMMVLWPFLGNITPVLLFYLAFAPGGILFLMQPQEHRKPNDSSNLIS